MNHLPSSIRRERGSALLIVLTLMVVMSALVIGNSLVLGQLRQELKLIDRQQQRKFESPRN